MSEVRPAPPEIALAWVRPNSCASAGPLSLTASDGTGLRLAELDAHAVVEGPLAYTELRLSFDNPEARVLEGRFSIQLPPRAALSRFAMAIDDRWQEGEVVERQAARVAYEDFLHRKQDPALLEGGAGNRFEARVFPIPAKGRKQLVIAWSQALPSAAEPYVLPVCGLPELDALDVEVLVRGPDEAKPLLHRVELHEKRYSPKQDLELRTGNKPAPILRAGDLAVARVTAAVEAGSESLDTLAILFDTSASRALDYEGQIERLLALVAELGRRRPDTALTVVAFDQSAETIYSGPAAGFGAGQAAALRARGPMGASDLGVGLAALGAAPRVVYVGDGIFTAGAAERGEALEALRTAAKAHGIERFDAIVDGGLQDRPLLEDLARGELARDGVVLDARVSAGHLADRIEKPTRSGLPVSVAGASWWWPRTVDGIQPGDAVLVYAQLPEDRALEVTLGEAVMSEEGTPVASAPRPLLQRAAAAAKIEDLSAQLAALGSDVGGSRGDALRQQIVDLSTSQRVLSDYTALLVLETEQDYARFGIERTAMADVLTVGANGIELIRRGGLPVSMADGGDKQNKWDGDERLSNEEASKRKSAVAERPVVDAPIGNADVPTTATTTTGADAPPPAPPARPGAAPTEAPRPASPVPEPAPRDDAPRFDRGESGGRMGGERLEEDRSREQPSEVLVPSDPYDGELAEVMKQLDAGNLDRALELATAWRAREPGNVLALVALGEVLERKGDLVGAARAYGSIIDLFPSRTDLRRMAGERLERLGEAGLPLAIDSYETAVAQRPDHPSSHRLFAYALLRAGRHEEAFNAIVAGLDRSYPEGRFAQVERILREDLGLIGAAWLAAEPTREPTIVRVVGEHHAALEQRPSLRFVLNWETDANDVDLHVIDGKGNHAFFRQRQLASGGELYADVTTGYGPECLAIPGEARAFPYQVRAHYYARGPMGYGMGKLEVIEHDGHGKLSFREQPFVLMKDNAFVDLLKIEREVVTKTK
ncbi:MAG: tetratricopeptide repeat protein [Nannocystaceae bacterium]|nr:tetratricopeptide repeat protein [Nannocystaceae bacterium]